MRLEKWLTACLMVSVVVAATQFGVFDRFSEHEASKSTDNLKPVASQRPIQRETTAVFAQDTGASAQALSAGIIQGRQVLEEQASDIDAQGGKLTTPPAELRRSLDQEREISAALTIELTKLRSHLETTLALSSKSQDDAARQRKAAEDTAEVLRQSLQQEQAKTDEAAARQRQAAEREVAELRKSLQQEQEKAAALVKMNNDVKAATASDQQQGRALEEAKVRVASLASELAAAGKAAAQQKQAAEHEIAELRQSLQQEQEKSAVLVKVNNEVKAATASAQQQSRALEEAQARVASLASELAAAGKADETAAQQKQAAEHEIAELRQSLQQEQEKSAALVKVNNEVEAATASAQQQSRALEEAKARTASFASELAAARKADEAAAQQKQAAEREIAELRKSLQQEQEKSAALVKMNNEVKAATASAQQQDRALEEAKARTASLASELAATRKADEAAAQQKQAAEREIAELRQSLQQEQEKSAALIKVNNEAKAATAGAQQQGRALEEAQARVASLASELAATRNPQEEAAHQKQAAGREILLQQGPSRMDGMARAPASAQRPIGEPVTAKRAIEVPIVPMTPTAAAAAERPVTADQDKAEAARLIARASALLGQGNIGAARIVLERAAENDNARARFMLAETYDPVVLSAWGTYGTRGEAAKARELYAKAQSGGIREAKDRLEALGR
ncbi:hypothetical protein CT676_09880 [Bradyrhizobium sp. MOS001]|uniref:hypothetical protein n=1 Tax=Bradyrhizobium sp. MOS001 TaxID=2133948 RepID=UPI00107545EB|nr:hypothetical protein [Bradyrhizobium sp. MOS001]TFW61177.1 hypothetical protein CT676_09880 [Bradyrhizobium sp. MOS001]